MVNKGEIDMQKLVVDAPDKLEKGESFGPGGVRINGKMKIQYKNPETLENYLKRENKTQYTRNINAVCGNEKVDNRITKIAYGNNLIIENNRYPRNDYLLIDRRYFDNLEIKYGQDSLYDELFRSEFTNLGYIDSPFSKGQE